MTISSFACAFRCFFIMYNKNNNKYTIKQLDLIKSNDKQRTHLTHTHIRRSRWVWVDGVCRLHTVLNSNGFHKNETAINSKRCLWYDTPKHNQAFLLRLLGCRIGSTQNHVPFTFEILLWWVVRRQIFIPNHSNVSNQWKFRNKITAIQYQL